MWILKQPESEFFTAAEKAQIEALLEGILPGGETSPGARDAGAADYLSRLLAMAASDYYEIPKWQQLYRTALPILDSAAKSLFGGKGLSDMTAAQRRDFLTKLSQGTLEDATALDQKTFF